ncbi:MAG: cadherin-like domain-containing protein, partial [Rhodobacteraceae bacterium]|nr:cadherin-like domain-containing protein [Paracoccaceae bacterium]
MVEISFEAAGTFSGAQGAGNVLSNPTSLQFGPDGRLYVSEQNGSINAFTVELQGDTWVATDHELIMDGSGNEVVKSLQNHFDDGSEWNSGNVGNAPPTNRQVTGILVGGTSDEPILYISSSSPSIASNGEVNLDTNSGVLTQASWNNTTQEWEVVDLVRGLPRSEENHAVNGMVLTEGGSKLLLQVGGFTNNGAPSGFFSYTNEYALSGSILEIDLVAVNDLTTQNDPQGGQNDTARAYKYDLPTLDDPNVENITDGVGEDEFGMDESGPWGGNDGLNMAILPGDAPLRIYADGLRNAYDLAIDPVTGNIYSVDNGSNGGLGGAPATEAGDDDGDGIFNEAITSPSGGSFGEGEPLIKIVEGGYYYHANPVRSNQNQSWTVYNDAGNEDTSLDVSFVNDISALVPAGLDIPTGFLINPSKFAGLEGLDPNDPTDLATINARLALSGETIDSDNLEGFDPDGAGPGQQVIEILGSSTNGIVAYDSGGQAFDGSIDGALFVTQFNDNITLLNINEAGTDLEPILESGPDGIFGTSDDEVQDPDGVLFIANNSLGVPLANPLDVVQGPNGTLWVAEIGGNEITVLAPSEFVAGPDLDADNDGILNVDDPFIRDASNGTSVVITPGQQFLWDFDPNQDGNLPGPDGFGGGLTGVMINGVTDFEDFFQSPRDPSDPSNSQINLDNVKFITAAGGGTTVIEEVSTGDPFQGANTGEFLFHTGFTLGETVENFTVTWTVANPNAGSLGLDLTNNFQQLGGYIGDGTQSNYLKVVAIAANNPAAGVAPNANIQIALENADGTVQTVNLPANGIFDPANLQTDSDIVFTLEVNPVAATALASATYVDGAGAPVTIAADPLTQTIDLSGSNVLEAILGNNTVGGQSTGVAAGLFSSSTLGGGDTFQAVFKDLEVSATEAEVAPVANDDSASTPVDQILTIPVSTLLANDTDANAGDTISFVDVSNPVNGQVEVNGGVVSFTPTPGFEGPASFDYTIQDDGGLTASATVDVSVADRVLLYRVNAGGGEVAAIAGSEFDPSGTVAWAANTGTGQQSGDGFSVNTGNISTHGTLGRADAASPYALPDYVPQEIFNMERWDPGGEPEMLWSFDAPTAGTYTVNLFMANGFDGTAGAGTRVFDIAMEGALVEDDLDLSATLGNQVGGLFTYEVDVTDGALNIEFLHQIENPLVNAIEIIGPAAGPATPTISIVSGDEVVSEADGTIQVSVITSETVPIGEDVTFVYEIAGVSATPEGDYSPNEALVGSGTATFTGNATIAGGSADFQLPIDILQDMEEEFAETFTVTITSVSPGYDIANGSATITIQDDDSSTEPGNILYRVNAGGAEVIATDGGPNWSEDTQQSNSPFLVNAGSNNDFPSDGSPIATQVLTTALPLGVSIPPQEVLGIERWDNTTDAAGEMAWAFDVAAGTNVEVRVYIAELFTGIGDSDGSGDPTGDRSFDILVDGALTPPPAFDDIDPYVLGGNAFASASVVTYQLTSDGTIDLEFIHGVENPAIKAIEIVALDETGPPVDSIDGVAVDGDDFSSDAAAPTAITLPSDGSLTVASNLEGGHNDRDFITVSIPEGQILTGLFLTNYVADLSNSSFIGLNVGSDFVVDPAIPALGITPDGVVEPGDLEGGYIFNDGDIGSNLLPLMNNTGAGFAGFDAGGLTGDVTIWLNQGGDASQATLTFVTAPSVDVAPEFSAETPSEIAVDENTTAVFDFDATDANGTAVTFSLGGDDAAAFSIDETTGELAFNAAPDFEAPTDFDGDNVYDVEVIASSNGLDTAQTVTVTVNDTIDNLIPGDLVIAINAGGPALTYDNETPGDTSDDIAFVGNTGSSGGAQTLATDGFAFNGGNAFNDNNGGNGQQPVFDGTPFETERNTGPAAFAGPLIATIDVSGSTANFFEIDLYFAELFQDAEGDRVFDVYIENTLVLDDFDILGTTGDFNTPIIQTFSAIDPTASGLADAIEITFDNTNIDGGTGAADNAAITGIVVRELVETDITPPIATISLTLPAIAADPITATIIFDEPIEGDMVDLADVMLTTPSGDVAPVTVGYTPGTLT